MTSFSEQSWYNITDSLIDIYLSMMQILVSVSLQFRTQLSLNKQCSPCQYGFGYKLADASINIYVSTLLDKKLLIQALISMSVEYVHNVHNLP